MTLLSLAPVGFVAADLVEDLALDWCVTADCADVAPGSDDSHRPSVRGDMTGASPATGVSFVIEWSFIGSAATFIGTAPYRLSSPLHPRPPSPDFLPLRI